VENPNRFIFFEEWQDMPALQAHFAVPGSQGFVTEVAGLAISPPVIKIFESTQVN
jgi:quinol monooxygenase YgiN